MEESTSKSGMTIWIASGIILACGLAVMFVYLGGTPVAIIGGIAAPVYAGVAIFIKRPTKSVEVRDVPGPSHAAEVTASKNPQGPSSFDGETLSLRDQLNPEQIDTMCEILENVTVAVAEILGLPEDQVRGNVFGLGRDGYLHIMNDFNANMHHRSERGIKIPRGQGSNGRAWNRMSPNIAIRREDFGDCELPADQAKRVAPTLMWIISVPVIAFVGEDRRPIWILNTDGLEEARSLQQVQKAVGVMLEWAEAVSGLLRPLLSTDNQLRRV